VSKWYGFIQIYAKNGMVLNAQKTENIE